MDVNSLAPGKFEWNFRNVISKQILVIEGWDICCKIALKWMSLDFTDVKSTLVQVMAWCRQATSHYLSQCWPRSLSPQWVKLTLVQWLSAFRQQVIPWANVDRDLCHLMASLGQKEVTDARTKWPLIYGQYFQNDFFYFYFFFKSEFYQNFTDVCF